MNMRRVGLGAMCLVLLFGAGCASQTALVPNERVSDTSCATYTDLQAALKTPEKVCHLDVSNQSRTGAPPAEIRHLRNLRILNASKNDMTGIPAEIGQLSELRELDLSSNKIDTMPDEIANLQNLEVLSLAHNTYRALPTSILQLKDLRRLDLTGNQISAGEIANIQKALPKTVVVF